MAQERRVNYKAEETRRSTVFREEIDSGVKYSFANMMKSSIEDTKALIQVLPGVFKIQ